MAKLMNRVAIIIPMLNEEQALSRNIASLHALKPLAYEVLFVDGGSKDKSREIAANAGFKVVRSPVRGRGAQINLGVSMASSDVICVLHADSILPSDAILEIKRAMANPRMALGSFMPRIAGSSGTRWGSTFHNWAKSWYVPLFLRPDLFLRGARLFYGDHAMFFRRDQFLCIGGCDEGVAIMEEADLCIKLSRFGHSRMIRRWVWTSDRRIAAWGRWRANWVYLKVGIMWALGARTRLADHYPDIR